MPEKNPNPPTCRRPDCEEPRAVYPKSRNSTGLCRRHESERVRGYTGRTVLDPLTGREVTASLLATYTWHRKRVLDELDLYGYLVVAQAAGRVKIDEDRFAAGPAVPAPEANEPPASGA